MLSMNQTAIREVLEGLENEGLPFSQYKLYIENNQLSVLGSGSFSIVYEMEDKNNPDKRYAMKVIGFNKCSVTSEKFRQTVGLQRALSERCDYIARIIDSAEIRVLFDEEGHYAGWYQTDAERWDDDVLLLQFVLMDKFEPIIEQDKFGNTTLLREELKSEENVLTFASQIGQAIHTMHLNHVLHRDIKLENIFWDKEEKVYKLGDFGIAKYVETGNAETIVYTEGYGAPEIERHFYEAYNATADIYSLGITLYLLLNELRFPGSEGYYANLVQYNEEFVFPAPANGSSGITRIIRKMCSYFKENRYQSVGDFLQELERIRSLKNQTSTHAIEYDDAETEYYSAEIEETEYYSEEEEEPSPEQAAEEDITKLSKREYKRVLDKYYTGANVRSLAVLSVLFVLFLYGMQGEWNGITEWQFWILPVVIFLGCFLTGSAAVFSTYAIGMILWAVIELWGLSPWIDWIREKNMVWIVFVLLMLVLNNRVRLDYAMGKISEKHLLIWSYAYVVFFEGCVIVGILLTLLSFLFHFEIPEAIQKLHLVWSGTAIWIIFYLENQDILKEGENNELLDSGTD